MRAVTASAQHLACLSASLRKRQPSEDKSILARATNSMPTRLGMRPAPDRLSLDGRLSRLCRCSEKMASASAKTFF